MIVAEIKPDRPASTWRLELTALEAGRLRVICHRVVLDLSGMGSVYVELAKQLKEALPS